MKQKFSDGTTLISGKDFDEWAKKVMALPKGKKTGCAQCKHANDEDYCLDVGCSHLWSDASCSCHINPPCSKCVDNAFEEGV